MPSDAQIIYSIVLILLVIGRGGFVVWALVLNMAAYFAASYAMDIHLVDRHHAVAWFAVIDAVTCAVMAFQPGPAKIIAAFFALRVNVYMSNLLFGVSTDTTFAIVWAIVALQVGVVIIGTPTGSGGARHRRIRSWVDSFASSRGISGVVHGGKSSVAQAIAFFSGRQ